MLKIFIYLQKNKSNYKNNILKKTMNKIFLISISLILIFNFSCTNSASSLKSNIDAIVIDAEKNYKNYSEDIWQKKDKEIEALTNKFNENKSKYTPEQIEVFCNKSKKSR